MTVVKRRDNCRSRVDRLTRTAFYWGGVLQITLAAVLDTEAASGASRFNLVKIYSDIAKSEYDIKWQDRAAAYQGPNRENNLRFTINADGFSAERRAPVDTNDNWRVTFTLAAYGSKNPFLSPATTTAEFTKNSGSVRSLEVDCEYTNDTNGLHQSFIVKKRPVEGGLVVDLALTLEGVSTVVGESENSVVFVRNETGEEVMEYSELLAFDADSRQLPASMEVADGHVRLVVDDANARYPVLVDPWTKKHTLESDPLQSGARFGFSVAFLELSQGAIAVGAPWFDDGLTDQGKVFVFYSDSAGLRTTPPGWAASGDAAGANFGYSLTAANNPGDGTGTLTFNNDTIGDLAVGEPEFSSGTGRVLVWHGVTDPDPGLGTSLGVSNRPPDKVLTGSEANGKFGFSLAAGDVTGDLFQDLIVGAPSTGGTFPGTIHLFKGSTTGLPSSPNASRSGETQGGKFGFSVSFAGNVDGGGQKDVLVGAPNYQSGLGKAYLYDGTSTGLALTPYWTFVGTQNGAQLGYSVFGNLNVENDGSPPDFVVSAPFHTNVTTNEGRVLAFAGRPSGALPVLLATLESPGHQAGARFGYSLSGGNVNREQDPFDDVLIGAPLWDVNPDDNKGRIFIYYGIGTAGFGNTPDQVDSGQATMTNEHFGSSVAFVLKIASILDPACFVGGAPEANPQNVTNGGIAVVYQFGTR